MRFSNPVRKLRRPALLALGVVFVVAAGVALHYAWLAPQPDLPAARKTEFRFRRIPDRSPVANIWSKR